MTVDAGPVPAPWSLTRVAVGLGSAVAVLGAAVVVGWILRWEPILRLHPSLALMQFNTAVLLIASGFGVIARARGAARLEVAIGIAVLVVAVPAFLQFPLERSLGVDTLLWVPFTTIPGTVPGRMAPTAAAAFMLIGLTQVGARVPRIRLSLTGAASTALMAVGGFALIELVFGGGDAGWQRYARVAVHTACAIAAVGVALGCLAWRDGRQAGGPTTWLPWAGGSGVLALTTLLATTLATVFPAEAGALVLATAVGLGATLAVLVYGALRLGGIARDRAAQVERASAALARSEMRNRAVFEQSAAGIIELDLAGDIVRANQRFCDIVGRSPVELARLHLRDVTHPDDREQDVQYFLDTVLGNPLPREGWIKRYLRPDGTTVWAHVSGSLVRNPDGTPLGVVGVVNDVSIRIEAQERLRASLEEKDVLLRELHHRVKNNLAVISSLFYLESTTTSSPEALRVLEESGSRVQSMALVHELLYRAESLSAVNLAEYATTLARRLLDTLGPADRTVALEIETVPVPVTVDLAIPCGLILNELLTNCLKHAFPAADPKRRPTIRLELSRGADGRCVLGVSDNGVGLNGVDPSQSRTLGMRLVRSLAKQVDGEVTFEPLTPGTGARLTFTTGP